MNIAQMLITSFNSPPHVPVPVPTDGNYYVTAGGTGTGVIDDPMGPSQFASHSFEANDNVFFNRGDIFILGAYDNAIANLTLDAYGTGDDPIIRGTNDISVLEWASEGSGVYSTAMAQEPNWVWINGLCAKNAETARFTVAGRPSVTEITITHGNVSGYTSIVGAYLVMKVNQFRNSQRVTVSSYSNPTITIDQEIPTANNIDYVLYNKREFLTGNNEWAWEDGMLYVKAAANPSTLNIRVSAYDYAFKATAQTTIQNIELCEYYHYAIHSDSGLIDVNNCNIHDCRDTAIYIEHQLTGVNVSDNLIERIGNTAITTRCCIDSTYNGNEINYVGMQGNYPWQTFQGGAYTSANPFGVIVNGAAIAYVIDLDDRVLDGSNCQFNDNVITNTAYNGIHLGCGTDNFILRNSFTDVMQRFTDGGAVYTFHFRDYDVPQENTEIANNICINTGQVGYGIYCDNRTLSANVHDNVASGFKWGFIFNTDTTNHTITDNISVDNEACYVFRSGDNGTLLYTENTANTFTGNLAVTTEASHRCLLFDLNAGPEPTWNPFTGGESDNNMYVAVGSAIADSDNEGDDLTLAALRSAYGEDINSESRISSDVYFEYNATSSPVNGNAGAGYETFGGVETDAYTIPAHYAVVLFGIPIGGATSVNSVFFESANSQYVDFGTHADIQFTHTSAFSISFWFKVPSNPASSHNIVDNRDSSGRGYVIQITSSGFIQIQLVNTITTNRLQLIGSTDYADNAWHHLLFLKNSTATNSVVYIDGALTSPSKADNLSATIASTENLNLGRRATGVGYFDGYIDELAIWQSNQSANVAAIYNAGVTHDMTLLSAPPLHYWKLGDDGYVDSGSSANKLDGTAFNSPTISTDVP